MKIAVLFDAACALGPVPDMNILSTVEAVEAALEAGDVETVRIPVNPDGRWVERIRRGRFDLAFNLCEGVDGAAALEPAVIGALELLGVPFTGCTAWTAAICLRKDAVNALLDRGGLPIPPWAVARRGAPAPAVEFPAIAKPAAEDASIGVGQASIVRSPRGLSMRLRQMYQCWEEILVQRYIDGREVNVGILGDQALPIAEIDFSDMPKGMWRIVSYSSKWQPGCAEDLGAVPRCPADLSPALEADIKRIALDAWRLVGGTGYGRVDMRIDADGQPWILEVNANPDFSPDAGLARMARAAGLDYAALVRGVCAHAVNAKYHMEPEQWLLAERLSGVTAPRPELVAVGQR